MLSGSDRKPFADGSGRLELARAIAARENPLTARVMVNRIWAHHFGAGIVPSLDNFGRSGDEPSNAMLLDWLATEFVRQGWSVKAMHRLMMESMERMPAEHRAHMQSMMHGSGNGAAVSGAGDTAAGCT